MKYLKYAFSIILLLSLTAIACDDGNEDNESTETGIDTSTEINSEQNESDFIVFNYTETDPDNGSPIANIYIYDKETQSLETVQEDIPYSYGPITNADFTYLVYTSGDNTGSVTLYNFETKALEVISETSAGLAYFDAAGNVIFNDGGNIYAYDVTTAQTSIIATPQKLNNFESPLKVSPDGTKLVIYEESGSMGEPGDHQSCVVVMNTDGTDAKVLKQPFNGWSNMYEWKQNSTEVLVYDHLESGDGTNTASYIIYNLLDESSIDLSNTPFGEIDEGAPNIGWFLSDGNWASFTRMKIYDATTGAELADATTFLSSLMSKMYGHDITGATYAANPDGTEVIEFDDAAY